MNEKKRKNKVAKELRKNGCPWAISWLLSRWKVAEAMDVLKRTYEIKLVGQTRLEDMFDNSTFEYISYYDVYSNGKYKFSFSQELGVFKFQREPFKSSQMPKTGILDAMVDY